MRPPRVRMVIHFKNVRPKQTQSHHQRTPQERTTTASSARMTECKFPQTSPPTQSAWISISSRSSTINHNFTFFSLTPNLFHTEVTEILLCFLSPLLSLPPLAFGWSTLLLFARLGHTEFQSQILGIVPRQQTSLMSSFKRCVFIIIGYHYDMNREQQCEYTIHIVVFVGQSLSHSIHLCPYYWLFIVGYRAARAKSRSSINFASLMAAFTNSSGRLKPCRSSSWQKRFAERHCFRCKMQKRTLDDFIYIYKGWWWSENHDHHHQDNDDHRQCGFGFWMIGFDSNTITLRTPARCL